MKDVNTPPILISLKPEYAVAILDGRKSVEFRKASFPKRVGTMVLYATTPVKKIVGTVKVKAVVVLGPEGAWRRYRNCGAIGRRSFNAYYKGASWKGRKATRQQGRKGKAHCARHAICLEIEKAQRFQWALNQKRAIEGF